MKTPNEIKNELKEIADFLEEKFGDCLNSTLLMRDTITYIQQLEAAQPKWISVEENPPAIGQRVIARKKYDYLICNMVLMEDGWYFDFPDQKLNYRATIIPGWWIPDHRCRRR